MTKGIRRFFHLRRLRAKLKLQSANRQAVSMEDAKRIGILFNATSGDDRHEIENFADLLRSNDKKVLVLGFIDGKFTHDIHNYLVFTKKNLNWYLEPSGDNVQRFEEEPFDILINAYTDECVPLEYISALSSAKFRVGIYHEDKTHCYDLMINLPKAADLGFYLNQIAHFLNLIHPHYA